MKIYVQSGQGEPGKEGGTTKTSASLLSISGSPSRCSLLKSTLHTLTRSQSVSRTRSVSGGSPSVVELLSEPMKRARARCSIAAPGKEQEGAIAKPRRKRRRRR